MKSLINKYQTLAVLLAAAALASGCASTGVKNPSGANVTELRPDERGFVAGTGVESQDLVAIADKMSRGILGVPQIANAQGVPCVVLDPIKNETRFPVNKDMFLTRIQTLLINKAAGKVSFLARDRMEALQREQNLKRTGQVTTSTDPNVVAFKGADFFLTGKFEGLSTRTSAGTSDYIQYTFQLIDAHTSVIIWSDLADVKRQGLEDAAYR